MTKQETFEGMKNELASVTADLQTAEAELSALHATAKTDNKTIEAHGKLQSKVALLTARKGDIEKGMLAAELAALKETVEIKNADLATATKAHAKIEAEVRERLQDLFEDNRPGLSLKHVVAQSMPVRESISKMLALNELVIGATTRVVCFASDHGLK
jgi:hypothetical protein